MKKFKLILSSILLALTLVFASAAYTPVYADTDPQGTTEKRPAPPAPAPSPSIGTIIAAILTGLGLI
jgi:hypothetical protein